MKPLLLLFLAVLCLLACQREPDFIDVRPRRADSTGTTDSASAFKAIVFDGAFPLSPGFDYDSLVFSVNDRDATVSHFARNRSLMWKELFAYDGSGRLTYYAVDYNPTYRRCRYSYAGTDSFPSRIVDSLDDSDLTIADFRRTGTQTAGGNTTHIYLFDWNVPTTGYRQSYNVKFELSATGQLQSAASEGQLSAHREWHLYNAAGLLDSTRTVFASPSYQDSAALRIRYGTADNPLAVLGKKLYKNLYPFQSHSIGVYSHHLSLWPDITGLFAPKLPLATRQYAQTLETGLDYAFQFNGNRITTGTVQWFDATGSPTTGVVHLRFY